MTNGWSNSVKLALNPSIFLMILSVVYRRLDTNEIKYDLCGSSNISALIKLLMSLATKFYKIVTSSLTSLSLIKMKIAIRAFLMPKKCLHSCTKATIDSLPIYHKIIKLNIPHYILPSVLCMQESAIVRLTASSMFSSVLCGSSQGRCEQRRKRLKK